MQPAAIFVLSVGYLYSFPIVSSLVYIAIAVYQKCVKKRWLSVWYSGFAVASLSLRALTPLLAFYVPNWNNNDFVVWGSGISNWGLSATQMLCLCAWHDSAAAFVLRGSQFKRERRRFRLIVAAYMTVAAVLILLLCAWYQLSVAMLSDRGDAGEANTAQVALIYFFSVNRLILSFWALVFGCRLAIRVRRHGIPNAAATVSIRKLQLLSVGAVIVWVSFALRGCVDIAIQASASFAYCKDDDHLLNCYAPVYLISELVPYFYFSALFYIFAFWTRTVVDQSSTSSMLTSSASSSSSPTSAKQELLKMQFSA